MNGTPKKLGNGAKASHARIHGSISARQEAACQDWWRESRSLSLQPRDEHLPTASEMLKALRQRSRSRQGGFSV